MREEDGQQGDGDDDSSDVVEGDCTARGPAGGYRSLGYFYDGDCSIFICFFRLHLHKRNVQQTRKAMHKMRVTMFFAY